MARESRESLLKKGASAGLATLASGQNDDTTPFALPVEVDAAAANVGAPNINAGQATAGADSGALVPARATRRSVAIVNTDAAETVYIGEGAVTTGNGFPLKAGQSVEVRTTAAINGIRGGGADVLVAYLEEYD